MSGKLFKNCKHNKSVGGKIPIHILGESDFKSELFIKCINRSIEFFFPESLKEANISPVFKKDDRLDKFNYSPVSIVSLILIVFGWLIHNHLSKFTKSFQSQTLSDFRKAYSTEHTLLELFQSWRK